MQYVFNVLFLSGGSPLVGQKGHKHPDRKRIKQLKKSFEKQKELENHLKTWRTLKNKKKKKKKKQKQNKIRENKKNNKTKTTIVRGSW